MKYSTEYGPVTIKFKDRKSINREVSLTVKQGTIYLNGTKLKMSIFLNFYNNIWYFYDKIGELTELKNKNISSYVISLFNSNLVKFRGNGVVNNWK